MVAADDDGWEADWQTAAPGNGGGQWQAIGGNVEQGPTMAAATRGHGSG